MSTTAAMSGADSIAVNAAPRVFAIVPAAGLSRRMGQPKLMLPWGETTVIGQLLRTLDRPWITARVVVARKDDLALQSEIDKHHAIAVCPDVDPPDMRCSVEHGLKYIATHFTPTERDAWLMLPADCPMISPQIFQHLHTAWLTNLPRFLVPVFQGRRGHPLIARWDTVAEIARLPGDVGLNQLLRNHADEVQEFPVDDADVLQDLDTPENYRAALARVQQRQ